MKYVSKENLSAVWTKLAELFVRKELKTDSQSEYKVLSDNNLTDELVRKINEAGSSTFTGNYTDLYGKPSIEGNEVQSGNQTAASLGLATPADITSATAGMATTNWVQEQAYQTATDVSSAVGTATSDMATQTWVTMQGYQTSEQVSSTVSTATAGMATQTWVEGRGYQTSSEVQSAISSAISGVYIPKGSSAFASLPSPSADNVGHVYNVTDQFTTTGDFVEGSGKSYPAGTNVVVVSADGDYKWDVMAGFVDLSGYVLESDLEALSDEEITEICK